MSVPMAIVGRTLLQCNPGGVTQEALALVSTPFNFVLYSLVVWHTRAADRCVDCVDSSGIWWASQLQPSWAWSAAGSANRDWVGKLRIKSGQIMSKNHFHMRSKLTINCNGHDGCGWLVG